MKPLLSLPHYMFHQSHATCNFNAIKDTITSLQGMATTTQSLLFTHTPEYGKEKLPKISSRDSIYDHCGNKCKHDVALLKIAKLNGLSPEECWRTVLAMD